MDRKNAVGRSMPRKSKHGKKVERWTTHKECKDRKTRGKWSKKDGENNE